jgi:threonine synthase
MSLSHVARSALDLIGSTPVVRLHRLPQLEGVQAEVWAKLENLNPGGSVKDRICLSMVEAAERTGRLQPAARSSSRRAGTRNRVGIGGGGERLSPGTHDAGPR